MTIVIIPKRSKDREFTVYNYSFTVYIYSFTVYIQVRSRGPREDSVDTWTGNSHTGFRW